MAFVSLYRKWRSQTFDEIVGQIHVTQTLKNAIEYNRIAHAYLFCGPRGTGKTSTARILAKALNCEKGPLPNPCNRCNVCKQISSGAALDVIEIDAASNRGINEIRDLREKVKYAPTKGRYKVYIVDEVHMLTKEAFNALLKTLEEPPEHVIFVLATTEPHKLLPTILSRCQRFDFKRISINDTVEHLKIVGKKEGLYLEDEAVNLIAANSEGSLRDALSLMDQLISFSGKNVKLEDVITVVGTVSEKIFFMLTLCVIEQDPAKGLSIIRKLIEDGRDINQLIKDFIQYFRDLLVIKICPDHRGLIDRTSSSVKEIERQAERITVGRIMNIIKILTDLKYQLTWDTQWHIQTEIAILKICRRSIDRSPDVLEERVRELEEKIKKLPAKIKHAQAFAPIEPGDLIGYYKEEKALSETKPVPEPEEKKAVAEAVPVTEPERVKSVPEVKPVSEPERVKSVPEVKSVSVPEKAEPAPEVKPVSVPEKAEPAPEAKSVSVPEKAEPAPEVKPVSVPEKAEPVPEAAPVPEVSPAHEPERVKSVPEVKPAPEPQEEVLQVSHKGVQDEIETSEPVQEEILPAEERKLKEEKKAEAGSPHSVYEKEPEDDFGSSYTEQPALAEQSPFLEPDEVPAEYVPFPEPDEVPPVEESSPAGFDNSPDEEIFQEVVTEVSSSKETADKPSELTIDMVKNQWEDFLYKFKRENLPLYQLLIRAEVSGLKGKVLTLAFTNTFFRDQIEDSSYRQKVEEALFRLLGEKVAIKGALIEKKAQEMSLFGDGPVKPKKPKRAENKDEPAPSIEDVAKLFGGEIIKE